MPQERLSSFFELSHPPRFYRKIGLLSLQPLVKKCQNFKVSGLGNVFQSFVCHSAFLLILKLKENLLLLFLVGVGACICTIGTLLHFPSDSGLFEKKKP